MEAGSTAGSPSIAPAAKTKEQNKITYATTIPRTHVKRVIFPAHEQSQTDEAKVGLPGKSVRSLGDVVMDALTLLCIDDRPQLLELRKALLESHGYRVNWP